MHRTSTTAALLVTVAVSAVSAAVSGCTTVQRPSAPALPSPPTLSEPRPDSRGEPQVVQAPAREALELIGPSHRPPAPASASARTRPAGPAAGPADPPRHAPADPPRRSESRRPEHRPVDRGPASVPSTNADVCALGRAYGGWPAGSPEAAICTNVYGR
ncbi:hypothetical protein ACLVWQ_15140 [Streptomyces sp. CWNU-52B]|uniref:hypothetical protein n=1 Tax=unclassified Streptomyces TaxID=2593676 RepID=UPI0039C4AE27